MFSTWYHIYCDGKSAKVANASLFDKQNLIILLTQVMTQVHSVVEVSSHN